MKKTLSIIIIILIILAAAWAYFIITAEKVEEPEVNMDNIPAPASTFEECVAAGYPVMESYPRQCRDNAGNTFTEDIGNELEKMDLIRLDSPRPNAEITSPLTITGQARGAWYFEADFPVILTDWDGLIIAEGIATAQGDWMTEDFVPFETKLTFNSPVYPNSPADHFSRRGSLILQRDNPSDLPENDDALEIPIIFK